jgi:hypothetical protein
VTCPFIRGWLPGKVKAEPVYPVLAHQLVPVDICIRRLYASGNRLEHLLLVRRLRHVLNCSVACDTGIS